MQWFRMYGEFATDPKVQMMSEVLQRRYIMLLCLRCSNGDVTLQDDEIAFQLRISDFEWEQTKATLQAKGLIDKDGKPANWEKRQYLSDSSAERVSRHREKKKQACNVTVTPPDSDSESEKKTPLPPKKGEGVLKSGEGKFASAPLMADWALDAAKANAPGWDIYHLAGIYDSNINSGKMERPRDVNRAFPAWVKAYTKDGTTRP